MKLSLYERMVLANQYAILEALTPEGGPDRDAYREAREALERGYEHHYAHVAEHFYDPMTESESREVLDILQMFRVITFSLRDVKDRDGLDEEHLVFDGFDGNEESKQHGYAKWFCELGRYTELTEREGFDFNSHANRLPGYRRMLAVWNRQGSPTKLTREQLQEIGRAAVQAV